MPQLQAVAKRGLIVLACISGASCLALFHPTAESWVRVKGRIVSANPENPSRCKLMLYRKDGDRLAGTADVQADFHETFVIAPGRHKYYVVVTCAGASSEYRSRVYDLSDPRYFTDGLDLGTITFATSVEKHEGQHKAPLQR